MPRTKEELEHFKYVLHNYFGLEDKSDIWLVVMGEIASQPRHTKRISFKKLATVADRLRINAFMQEQKGIEIQNLQARLKVLQGESKNAEMPEGASDLQADVSVMQGFAEGVVRPSPSDGVY